MSTKLITDELYAKASASLNKMSETDRVAIRLRAIVAAKEHGVNLVSKVFSITSNTLRNWVKSFSQNGVEALEYDKGRGRKSNIPEDYHNMILQWVQEDSNLTIHKILCRLQERGVKTSKSAVHRVLLQLNLSYITPRPRHYKQDPSKQLEFKKKST